MSSRDHSGWDDDDGLSGGMASRGYESSRPSFDSHSASHAADKKTTSFDSKDLISEDGMFLGMQLSPQTASMMRFIIYTFLPYVSKKVEESGGKLASNLAEKHFGITEREVLTKIGLKSASVAGVAVAFHQQIFDMVGIGVKLFNALNDIREAVEPVLIANKNRGGVLQARNNEVIDEAVRQAGAVAWADIIATGGRSIAALPQLILLHGRNKERQEKWAQLSEMEMLKDATPEKQREILNKQFKEKFKATQDNTKVFEDFLKEKEKEWETSFKAFAKDSKNIKEAETLLKQEYKDSTYRKPDQRLKKYTETKGKGVDREEREYFARMKEDKLRQMYIDKYGAFNQASHPRSGNSYGYSRNQNQPETHEQRYRKQFEELQKAQFEQSKSLENKDGKDGWNDMFHHAFSAMGAVAGEVGGKIAAAFGLKKHEGPIALDLILHMRRSLDEDPKRESIPPKGEKGQDSSFTQFVHKIFQEHQQDRGKPAIGERNFEHLQGAKWDDKDIFAMKDSELTDYEYAVRLIAKRIQDGRLDAMALVNLVGERKIVQANGKTFGPKGKNSTVEHNKEAILAEVNHECALFKPHHPGNQDKLCDEVANLTSSDVDYKLALGASGRQGEERAFIFARLDALIDNEKNMHDFTGLKAEEIKALRTQAQENKKADVILSAALLEVAEMVDGSPKALEKHKITAEEAEKISKIAADIKGGKTAEDAISHEDKTCIDTVLANVVMEEKGFFKKVEGRGVTLAKEREEQKAAEKAEKEEGGKHGKSVGHDGAEDGEYAEKFTKKHSKKNGVEEILKGRKRGYDSPDMMDEEGYGGFTEGKRPHGSWEDMAAATASARTGRHKDFKPHEGISL